MRAKRKSGSGKSQSSVLKTAVLIILVLTAIGLMATVFVMQAGQSKTDKEFFRLIGEQRQISLSAVTDALEASRGQQAAFERLRSARDRFDEDLLAQRSSLESDRIVEISSAEVEESLVALQAAWSDVRGEVATILNGREAVEIAGDLVANIEETIPDIQILSDEIAVALIESGAPSNEIYIATRQLLLLQRIENNVARLLGGGIETAGAADRFGRDVALFARVLEAMMRGDPGLGISRISEPAVTRLLNEVASLFAEVEESAGQILANSPELFQLVAASQAIIGGANELRTAIDGLSERFSTVSNPREQLAYVFGIVAALLLAGVAIWQIIEARNRAKESEVRNREIQEQNDRNQRAILNLLDELGDLAAGDLTVHASVTEDLTGSIADSINNTVAALRELVVTIHNTSEQVASAATDTSTVAERLSATSDQQTHQINSATESVDEMSKSMNEMSTGAAASAEVATNSVQIASQGGDRVRRTIQGMDVIREHIQETSKRIKRLGESSQEIGDIVSLINDIADQTNILALNAAIQAAAAGESGRGFAVVADEVQRLAERASNSTKRIEQLVKTIQADTGEAIISMEKSTSEVVRGADLAERAGESLEEIENVSNKLAELIIDISRAAREQSEVATSVSSTMISINELTGQTSEGTALTATSIGELAKLSKGLRTSVAGFKLPEGSLESAAG
jgi:twitching motility protein PilJ